MDDITPHLIIFLQLQITFQMNCEFSKIVLRFQPLYILISYFTLHLFVCTDYSYPCIWPVIHCDTVLNVLNCSEVETLLLAIAHIHPLLKYVISIKEG